MMSSSKKVVALSPSATESKAAYQLNKRLQSCWEYEFQWQLIPDNLKKSLTQVAQALSVPAIAVLAGMLVIVSYSMSHSVVEIEQSELIEPVLIWISICMPTGCAKSSLCNYLRGLVLKARKACAQKDDDSYWLLGDQSFEKLGELMQDNHWKILGLYDELPMFFSQINVCRGRSLTDSSQVSTFLQLYGGSQWIRKTVSGEANFKMDHTGLTIAGFTQANVAKGLIEAIPNVEKGLSQRFHWLFPKPNPIKFADLQSVKEEFSDAIVNLMASQWRASKEIHKWTIARSCKVYQQKFDSIFEQITKLSYADDLLSGMLSKSKGQILRVAATMHVLFHWEKPHDISTIIDDTAVSAAIDFVDLCIQHAAFITGRKTVQEEIEKIHSLMQEHYTEDDSDVKDDAYRSAVLSLTLPGKVLNMSALVYLKKFRHTGNKTGGLQGWKKLESDGLGIIIEKKAIRGTDKLYEFCKEDIPEDPEEKAEFAEKLLLYSVSLQSYRQALELDEITLDTLKKKHQQSPGKRKASGSPESISKRTLQYT